MGLCAYIMTLWLRCVTPTQDIGVRSYRNGPEETCVAQEGRTQEEGGEAPWCVAQAWQQEGRTQAQEALQEGLESQYHPER